MAAWEGLQPGDVVEISKYWNGPAVHGADGTSDWLIVSAGEQVTVQHIDEDGYVFVRKNSGKEGWLGGPGCSAVISLEMSLGPQTLPEASPTPQNRKRQRTTIDSLPKSTRTPTPRPSLTPAPPATPHPLFPHVSHPPNGVIVPSEQEILQLIEQRNEARKASDFALADRIRDDLNARGVILSDAKNVSGDLLGQQVTSWRYYQEAQLPVAPPPVAPPAPPSGRASASTLLANRSFPTSARVGVPSEAEILHLIEQRNEARKRSDYVSADRIRDSLKSRGVLLQDEKNAKGNLSGQEVTTWQYSDAIAAVAPVPASHTPPLPSETEITQLIEQRNVARKAGDYAKADRIRDSLKTRGVLLMDEKGARGDLRGQEVTSWRYWTDNPETSRAPEQDLPRLPSEIEISQLIEARNVARKSGDYKKADSIRDDLKMRGVQLMDEKGARGDLLGQEVTSWRYLS